MNRETTELLSFSYHLLHELSLPLCYNPPLLKSIVSNRAEVGVFFCNRASESQLQPHVLGLSMVGAKLAGEKRQHVAVGLGVV